MDNRLGILTLLLGVISAVIAIVAFLLPDATKHTNTRIAIGVSFLFITMILGGAGGMMLMQPSEPAVALVTHTPTPTVTEAPALPAATPVPPTSTPTIAPTQTPLLMATDTPTAEPTATVPPTNTPVLPTPSLVFEAIPLDDVSEFSYPQDNLGLSAGRQTLVGIPFDFGWTSSTQCSYIPGRPTQIDLHMDVPNPVYVYVLLQAGWGTQQYAGKEIGAIELRFSDGTAIRQPLVLGTNIRDWSVEDTNQAVNTATSPSLQEAWTGKSPDGRQGRMDLLTIPVSDVQGGNLKQITITDETQQTTGQMDPCIHLLAVTILHFQEPTS